MGGGGGQGGGGQSLNVLAVFGYVEKLSAILFYSGISYDDHAMAYDVTRYRS